MISTLALLLASTAVTVPDNGATGWLLGIGLLATGLAARLMKNRKR
jgi:uncharacterized membrane protein YhhN